MSKSHFGLIGLGVMGENLVLNAERNGFSSVVYNRTYAKTEDFLNGRGKDKNIQGATDLQDFVGKLERPRRILMMVKAGPAVDAVVDQLSSYTCTFREDVFDELGGEKALFILGWEQNPQEVSRQEYLFFLEALHAYLVLNHPQWDGGEGKG